MENPYEAVPPDARNVLPDEHHDDYLRRMVEGSRHDAWNEGRVAGKAEQAEIVSELVETLEVIALQMKVWSSGWPLSDLMQWIDEARANLNTAIAKAKGE